MTYNTTPIEHLKHNDKRANNPTEQLSDLVADDEATPKKCLYTRDASLDPQLVWTGKDQQNSDDFFVDTVPIYTQEKIKPKAIIEDIRATGDRDNNLLDLYSDFNGIDFEEMIDYYQHELNWSNRMILGDSLLVMNSLAEKESLKERVQMIYIDPPYGIKFGSNWQVSTRQRKVEDGKDVTREPEQITAYRDTWKRGIHSYLSYLRDRLTVARELLTESGSVFVQISDENVHLVRCVMDEVFGSENFFAQIAFRKMSPLDSKGLAGVYDILIWYAKEKSVCKFRQLFVDKNYGKESEFTTMPLTSTGYTASCTFDFTFRGTAVLAQQKSWRTTVEGMRRLILANRLVATKGGVPRYKKFFSDFMMQELSNLWHDTGGATDRTYVVETSPNVVQRCILMTTDPGDLVLDPTCGSGTTAYVAEQWGRRWITIDTSRVALALARTRLMSARYPYYILAGSSEGIQKEAELTNDPNYVLNTKPTDDIKKGFVYGRGSHIELKHIANNAEIEDIYTKWQKSVQVLHAEINKLAGKEWKEWEIPCLESAPRDIADKIKTWWELCDERQSEIDDSIARHSKIELFFDRPFENKTTLRVTGPFTVESLSPHRVLPSDDRASAQETVSPSFATTVIEHMKKAGIQNTRKAERLKFDWIEPYAGKWIHAEGEYCKNGEIKRVAISIGPETGTVSKEHVQEAVKEAASDSVSDLLIVCGFQFAPTVSNMRTRFGNLTLLRTRINTDLMMSDELKNTGTGNLFTVFGEPDMLIEPQPDGKIVVEVTGVDVYNPTTGLIRSNSPDDMLCWFIDSNYDGESFFVRHAYFTGAIEPYEKLKKALNQEIDESVWNMLYSTRSRPFDKPKTGKIAVKVINHYGDEVLKVYDDSYWQS